jgi:hypothetical protein
MRCLAQLLALGIGAGVSFLGLPNARAEVARTGVDTASAEAPPAAGVDTPAGEARSSTLTVLEVAEGRGFTFYPSEPPSGAFRLAIGGSFDAVDPQVMYGYRLRIPQFSLDARLGLSNGWSLRGHLNTMLVSNELLVGGSYATHVGRWSLEASASVGVFLGKLGSFGFNALLIAPQYRPELAVGHDFGDIAVTLRGSLLLMGPERVQVGDVWGGLDNDSLFAGHSEMLYVENVIQDGSLWYFGLGLLTTRAYYQMWLLFPDSPALFTYPRIAGGYEF